MQLFTMFSTNWLMAASMALSLNVASKPACPPMPKVVLVCVSAVPSASSE